MAAFSIKSESLSTSSAIKDLYNYLIDFNNFKNILPEDKVENFECSGDTCSFNIKGVTALTVRISEKIPNTSIKYQTEGLAKFNFILEAKFEGDAESLGKCNVQLHGDMNPFIKVMAEKPLTQLVNTMSVKLSQLKLG